MSINNITGNYSNYYKNSSIANSRLKDIQTTIDNLEKPFAISDSIDISTLDKNSKVSAVGGLIMDKGTAANTTLYVDKSTFSQIVSYSTNSSNCQWDELGIDDEKRWVVINGQRFECPLSEEEKEMRRRLRMGIIDILNEADEAEKEQRKNDYVKLNLGKYNKVEISEDNDSSNDKINNLIKNDKVMSMLADIIKINGGQGIIVTL